MGFWASFEVMFTKKLWSRGIRPFRSRTNSFFDLKYILLEWDKKKDGEPPQPLLKDRYGAERRKAKTLNFSIAYGKTAMGVCILERG